MKSLLALLLLAASSIASAEFSATQYQAIKADILADSSLDALRSEGNFDGIAQVLSAPVADKCWDSNFSLEQLLDALNFTAYIGRSVAEKSALDLMFKLGTVDTRRANIRQAFTDIFSGTGAVPVNQRQAITDASQRACLRIEKLLAESQSSGAYITVHEGSIGWPDVMRALTEF